MKIFNRLVFVTLLGAWLASGSIASAASSSQGPYNILYIMTDQQRFDALGVVNSHVQTPALDRLSKEGVRFDRTYVAQALCTPSRASIFSGLYPHTHKLQNNVYGVDNALIDPQYHLSVIWPSLLQKAGYHTGYIGKWHLGEKCPPCFDEWDGYNSVMSHWLGKAQKSQYRSDQETDHAIAFLEHNKDRQFALCVSYYPPHTPYDPPKKFADLYTNSVLKPAEYWGAVTAIDVCVGRLIEKLDSLGLRDRTLVIFTADHGDHFGLRGAKAGGKKDKHKGEPYDDSARVPLILRLPGMFEGGQVRMELISNVDLMPTILQIAGVATPGNLQGRSLVPLGHGSVANWRTLVCDENGKGESRGIRTDRYKLILRRKLKEGIPVLYELYDLQNDPGEHVNCFDTEHVAIVLDILKEFEAWAKSTGDDAGLALASACRKSLGKKTEK